MPSDSEKRDALLILGMHRSGTSALARVVNLLGFDAGNKLMGPVEGDTPRGFWENVEIVDLHDRLLATLASSWSDTNPLPRDRWSSPDIYPFRRELEEILDRNFSEQAYWMVKDPRLCRLLPFWQWCAWANGAGCRVGGHAKARGPVRHSFLRPVSG